jgi:hypothetical protein
MGGEVFAESGGEKLTAVVALHASDGGVILRGNEREESQESVTSSESSHRVSQDSTYNQSN